MTKLLFILLPVILMLYSAFLSRPAFQQEKFIKLKRASFILGSWNIKMKKGQSMEVWSRQSDSTFEGKSWVVVDNDTVSRESILLVQRGENLFYIPTVKDQNNGEATTFRLTAGTENRLVFENMAHDFPQVIRYSRVSDKAITADISGIVNGSTRSEIFHLTRKK